MTFYDQSPAGRSKIIRGQSGRKYDHNSARNKDRAIEGLEQLVHFQLSHDHPLIALSDYIVQHWRSPARDAAILQHCAWVLLAEIRAALAAPPRPPAHIRHLKRFIETHMDESISIDDLAGTIDRTPSHVNRICRRHLGTSAGNWIAHTKITCACELLRSSNLPIATIALRTGYTDPFYFSRLFRKHIGVSPRQYRQQQGLL